MKHERVFLEEVVESLADGHDVDWNALEQRLDSDGERRVLEQLKVLARIAEVHRSHANEPEDDPPLVRTRVAGKVIPMPGSQAADAILPPPLPALAAGAGAPPVAVPDAAAGGASSTATAAIPGRAPLSVWGHLELHERIGEGTFGEVYRARDLRLDREVAVKLLRVGGLSTERQTRRIVREGRILAKIQHEHVVAVHGVETHDGRVGLWMALIRGKTLEQVLRAQGPFSAREAMLIGQDLCSALGAVHKAGLVHRDIKPQNVMREEGGRLVLMDFGAGQIAGTDNAALDRLTGTPLYLAPEVLAGAESTAQSDIYSLGILLYHLVSGDYPLRATSLADLRAGHAEGRRVRLHDLRPELETGLVQVIERAIEPRARDRYATAGEMRAALDRALGAVDAREPRVRAVALPVAGPMAEVLTRGSQLWTLPVIATVATACLVGAGAIAYRTLRPTETPVMAAAPRIVAVLDLARGNGVQEHEAASITEGIQDLLSSSDRVRGISRRSVQVASHSDLSAPALAARLGVDYLIEGRVDQDGQELQATLRLIRAGSDQSRLLGTFRAPLAKRQLLVRPAANAVATALGVALPPTPSARTRSFEQLGSEAQDRYARARYYINTVGYRSHPQAAVQLFEEAIAAAPAYGEAYAGLARAEYYAALASKGELWRRLGRARTAAERALGLDPTLVEAQTVIALANFYEWKWQAADEAFLRAVALGPTNDFAVERYAMFLASRGRVDEGLSYLEQLRQLDPLSSLVACSMASMLQYAGRYDEALAEVKRARELDPADPAAQIIGGRTLAAAGRYDEAVAEFKQALANGSSGGVRWAQAEMAAAHAGAGRRAEAMAMLAALEAAAPQLGEGFQPELLAFVYAQLGDRDTAFQWLEKAMDERSPRMLLLNVDPRARPLHGDPRFAALLTRLELRP